MRQYLRNRKFLVSDTVGSMGPTQLFLLLFISAEINFGPAEVPPDLPTATVVVISPQPPFYHGDVVILRCCISEYTDWQYYWYRDGNYVKTSENIDLRLPDETGQYSCYGWREPTQKSSSSAPFDIKLSDLLTATVVVVSPQPCFYSGERVTLRCDITNNTDWVQYNWYKDNSPVPSKTSEIITITLPQEAGQYHCYGQRSDGPPVSSSSSAKEITYCACPTATVIIQSPQAPFYHGDKVILRCDIEEQASWDQYYWYRDNGLMDSNMRTITITLPEEAGQYNCSAKRGDPSFQSHISQHLQLQAQGLPKATISADPQNPVFTGETISLKCVISSQSGWRYRWHKDGHDITMAPVHHQNKADNTLTINEAQMSDNGNYKCMGERYDRPTFSQISNDIHISITEEKPSPSLSLDRVMPVLSGNNVTLTCDIGQSAGWRFYWYKDIQTSSPVTQTDGNTYTISSVEVSHGGQYWCRAGRGDPLYLIHYSSDVWVNVTVSALLPGSSKLVTIGAVVGVMIILVIGTILLLLYCFKKIKKQKAGPVTQTPLVGQQQQDTSQNNDQSHSAGDQGYELLHSGTAHVYDTIHTDEQTGEGGSTIGPSDVTYATICQNPTSENVLKKKKKDNGGKSEPNIVYSELKAVKTTAGDEAGHGDLTYVQVTERKKHAKAKEPSVEAVYSEVKPKTSGV